MSEEKKDLTKEEKMFVISVFSQMTFNIKQDKSLQLAKSIVEFYQKSLEVKTK